jgi:hypothetical protein
MSNSMLARSLGIQRFFLTLGVLLVFATGCAQVPTTPQSPSKELQSAAEPAQSQQPAPSTAQTSSQPAEVAVQKRIETVTAERLAVRSEPNNKSKTVTELRKGEIVEVKDPKNQGWVNVVTPGGKEGWVYGGSLTGFPELTNANPKKTASKENKTPKTGKSTQTQKLSVTNPPVADALDSELAAGKKTPKASKPDDSVMDQPAGAKPTRPVVDDSVVTGQKP